MMICTIAERIKIKRNQGYVSSIYAIFLHTADPGVSLLVKTDIYFQLNMLI